MSALRVFGGIYKRDACYSVTFASQGRSCVLRLKLGYVYLHNQATEDILMKLCSICDKPLVGRQQTFCSVKCKNTQHQSYAQQQKRAETRKRMYVEKSGGCCSICGYDKNLAALVFHHKEPKDKMFRLDARSLSNRTEARIEQEFRKCSLLCANCHAELHNPHLSDWKLVGPPRLELELNPL